MKKVLVIVTTFLSLVLINTSPVNAALLPSAELDAVVSIGFLQTQSVEVGDKVVKITSWATSGTGFLYGWLINNDSDPTKRQYKIFLVTAKHVIKDYPLADAVHIRVNSKNPKLAPEFSLSLKATSGQNTWFFGRDGQSGQPNQDVAATEINYQSMRQAGLKVAFFPSDMVTYNNKQLQDEQVSEGDGVYVLGFPSNTNGVNRNYVVVKQGIIARIGDMLDGTDTSFMIDSLVFPGNSGGPVILKPELAFVTNTKPHPTAELIGMVIEENLYNDVAVSQQTKINRVLFQENLGLANVVPMEMINDVIREHEAAADIPNPVSPQSVKPEQKAGSGN